MSGIKQICSKELARIFKDRKMIFSVFILPVIIMVGVMTLVSSMAMNQVDDVENHTAIVYVQNAPEDFEGFLKTSRVNCTVQVVKDDVRRMAVEKDIKGGEADLLIEFPENFMDLIDGYQPGSVIPQIKTFYNPSENYSREAYDQISNKALEGYRQMLLSMRVDDLAGLQVFSVNADNPEMVIQDDAKAGGKALGMMLPYFVTILLFAGAMGIGTDMIAGEKERGTMSSLLVSPIKRSSIVLGKVISLMIISGVSSVVYVGAMVAFMPQMMNGMSGGADSGLNMTFSVQQIVMLAALLVAIAFLYSTVIILVSVFAKNVKEASSYIMPVYMLVLILGITTMFGTNAAESWRYMVPIYNTSLTLQGILSQEVTMMQYGMTLGVTLALGGIMIVAIVKAFESEKVMSA